MGGGKHPENWSGGRGSGGGGGGGGRFPLPYLPYEDREVDCFSGLLELTDIARQSYSLISSLPDCLLGDQVNEVCMRVALKTKNQPRYHQISYENSTAVEFLHSDCAKLYTCGY